MIGVESLLSELGCEPSEEEEVVAPLLLLSLASFQWSPQLPVATALPCNGNGKEGGKEAVFLGSHLVAPRRAAVSLPPCSLEVPGRKAKLCVVSCTLHLTLRWG